MQKFIKFPKIGQFRDCIKSINDICSYHNLDLPEVEFTGTVKLHGTNAAVVISKDGTWHCQSRERIITPLDDNAGFAAWVYGNKGYWDLVAEYFSKNYLKDNESVQIYGEWCGGNIQKNVGVAKLPKMFVIFGMRISADEESNKWYDSEVWNFLFEIATKPANLYSVDKFKNYQLKIDFNYPTRIQNQLVELTNQVEQDCPVARVFIDDTATELVGEGIVWQASNKSLVGLPSAIQEHIRGLRFKVKGVRHSQSKVKTIAAVDLDNVKSIEEFVEYACTTNRLDRALAKLQEKGLELSIKNTGEFIKLVITDLMEEELETMISSGIEPKDVNGAVSKKASLFFRKQLG